MIVPIAAAAWRAPERAALGWRDHMLTMLFGTWLMVGLFVDGWAHSNLEQLESFFTPWHALFYSGFGATAFWIAWCVRREGALPRGYAPAVLGVFAFGAGGVGDLIWHTLFGIEKDVEALLSPTHLLLFASMLAILASPLRAAWSAPGESAPSFRAFLPALLFGLMHLGGLAVGAEPLPTLLLSLSYVLLGFAYAALLLRTGVVWPLILTSAMLLATVAASQDPTAPNLVASAESVLPALLVSALLAAYGWLVLGRKPGPARPDRSGLPA